MFVRYTDVADKTDSEAKKQEGFEFARLVFRPAYPRDIALKPNLVGNGRLARTEEGMGKQTDVDFVEGMIEDLLERGIRSRDIFLRDGIWVGDLFDYFEPAQQTTGKSMFEGTNDWYTQYKNRTVSG